MTQTKVIIVDDQAALSQLAETAARSARIAIDTEGASFHRYVDRVYLVQIATDTVTALVDPLAVPDLSPVGDLLRDNRIEIILHDAVTVSVAICLPHV